MQHTKDHEMQKERTKGSKGCGEYFLLPIYTYIYALCMHNIIYLTDDIEFREKIKRIHRKEST